MRHLDAAKFDKHGRPLNTSQLRASAWRGTHARRQGWRSRILEVGFAGLGLGFLVLACALPLTHLSAAWLILAVYVLIGFLATLGRLVPVRTS
jgi:hypothetical protein